MSAATPRCRRRAGDQHHIGMRLADSGRDGADADLRHELHVHSGPRVGVLEVVDELCEVLDRVMSWCSAARSARHRAWRSACGRSAGGPCCREADRPPRAWLLRHLDLDVISVDEVLAGDAEASAGDLLHRGPALVVAQPFRVLPPSPVLDLPPRTVHRDRRVSCASMEIDPYDIAPVENRRTMSETGSTSSMSVSSCTPSSKRNSPRGVSSRSDCSSTRRV